MSFTGPRLAGENNEVLKLRFGACLRFWGAYFGELLVGFGAAPARHIGGLLIQSFGVRAVATNFEPG